MTQLVSKQRLGERAVHVVGDNKARDVWTKEDLTAHAEALARLRAAIVGREAIERALAAAQAEEQAARTEVDRVQSIANARPRPTPPALPPSYSFILVGEVDPRKISLASKQARPDGWPRHAFQRIVIRAYDRKEKNVGLLVMEGLARCYGGGLDPDIIIETHSGPGESRIEVEITRLERPKRGVHH